MSTYSLTLRSEKNSRLSIAEMDNNFLYLEELALSGSAIDLENVITDIIPSEDSVYNLGSSASQWKSLHVSGQTIYVGGVPLSTDGDSLIVNSITSNSINLGTTASPLILSADNNNKLLLNGGGYKGFYAGINRLFGDDPTITQVVISKSPNASYKNRTTDTENDDFYVTGLSGSDTVVVLNIYGTDTKKPLKIKDIRNFVEKFVDTILYTDGILNSDLIVIKDLFYNNIEVLTSSLPTGTLYRQFVFQDQSVEYKLAKGSGYATTGTGNGTFSLFKREGDYKGYEIFGEGGPNNNFTYGFQSGDVITISGTAVGGTSPFNDVEINIFDTAVGVINTFDISNPGTGYVDGYYNIASYYGNQAYAYITTASGSVTDVTLVYGGTGYEVLLGEGFTIQTGDYNATIAVLSTRDGVIDNYQIIGKPDYSSPYRNSSNPWPVRSIGDGGYDQYDGGNYITTDKSITEFIGSIQYDVTTNTSVLTVTEIISGTLSVGQVIKHNLNTYNNYSILTGETDGGVGTYSVSGNSDSDRGSRLFTAYGINYGAGEVIEDNSFGSTSSYVTLYDEGIFAMVAVNVDIDTIWYSGDTGSDGRSRTKKEVNVLIADDNSLSLGDSKIELSNKDLILPETDTLGWMSVFGNLHNYDYDIAFRTSTVDSDNNTYSAGYEHDNNKPIVVKFNKTGDVMWSIEIYNDENYGEDMTANSIKIDPVNGDLVVLCETYPDPEFGSAEGLIIRIDAETGEIKKVNRLRDLNTPFSQGDLYLYDMTFNSNNELIIVGRKDEEYLEWVIGTSSVLAGSTMSTLVISPSSIGNNIPDIYGAWSIAGTDIIGDEIFSAINVFTGVTGSTTPGGTNAAFTIQANTGTSLYTITSVDTPGTGYTMSVLKPIVVPGTKLGGLSPDNDATILQTSVSPSGGILVASISGTATGQSPSSTYSFAGVTGSTIEGSGAIFDIHIVPTTGEYEIYNTANGGSNYVLNDIVTIPGAKLGGTSSNNCVLVVDSINNGSIDGIGSISGTGSTSSLYLTIETSVDFSASGTWSIYKSLGGEAYIYTENWEKTLGGGTTDNDKFNSVITDADDNIYVVGEAWGGGITTPISDNQMAIVSKFNSNGDHLWTKVLNDQDYECSGKSIAILGTNSIVATHYSDWDGEIIISKLTIDGDLLWQKRTNGDFANVVTDESGIYILGAYYDDNNFGENSLKLFKLNTDGVMEWSNVIGGKRTYSLIDSTNGFLINNDKLIISGWTNTTEGYYKNAFVANLPKDGSLVNYQGITSYVDGNYRIRPTYDTYFDTFTPTIGTHSATYSRDFYFYINDYNQSSNLDRINDVDSGIVFSDGTKQTSSAGIIPQNYQPFYDDYYLQLSDIGKHIYKDDGDGYAVYIPLNKDVPFPIGTTITVVSGNSWTKFRIDDWKIELWGAGFNERSTYYQFYIPNNSIGTLLKVGQDKWIVSSPNLGYDD